MGRVLIFRVWLGSLCCLLLSASDSPKATFEAATRALAAGNYAAAEQGFRAVLRAQPNNVGALGNLGIVYARTGRRDQAIGAYRRALDLSPNDTAILLNLGLVYLKEEQHAKAAPLFNRVVEEDPKNLQARQLRAVCRLYTGQTDAAVHDLEELLRGDKQNQDLFFLLGLAYLKDNDPAKAKEIFERMFELAGPARTEFLLGKACYESGRFESAEESFHKVAAIDSSYPGLHLERGKLYISQGRAHDAIRELRSVLQDAPSNEDANYYLGALLVREMRYQESLPYLERAVQLRPDSWSAYVYLGKAMLRLEKPAAAVALLKKAVALNPEDSAAYFQLGRALQAAGREQEATRAFRQSREVSALKDNQIIGIR